MLPTEMADISRMVRSFRQELESRDYGEIHTPALEYEDVLAVGDLDSTEPAFRLLDDTGKRLVLRSDMTIPTARLVATRLREQQPPFRLYYVSHIYRGRTTQPGQPREFLQIGAELIGRQGPSATLELLDALTAGLDAVGLDDYRIVLGDASLYPRLLRAFEVPSTEHPRILHELVTRDFVGLRRELEALGGSTGQRAISDDVIECLHRIAGTRGGPEILSQLADPIADACENLRRLVKDMPAQVQKRVLLDLGMARKLGYYTGEVFEVHHPRHGQPLGGGGRYDELLARFGRPMEAIGFGINVERLHTAVLADDEERRLRLAGDWQDA